MKILVFGAGVLGCNLARNLFRAGKDVTLFARGKWAEEIREHGLRIKDKFSPFMSVSRISVVMELKSDDEYDVIFVIMRYTQIGPVIDVLRANRTKNVIFVGNNVSARATATLLPDATSNEQLIRQIFDGTKYRVAYERNMEDYLLCHAAFVLPAAFACYKADGDLKKFKGNTAYLNRLINANIEGYRAIRNAGHEILPKEDQNFEGAAYRRTCLRFFKLICATGLGKICVSDHAMNAVDEMSALNWDLKRFFDENGAEYPVWKELEKECGNRLLL